MTILTKTLLDMMVDGTQDGYIHVNLLEMDDPEETHSFSVVTFNQEKNAYELSNKLDDEELTLYMDRATKQFTHIILKDDQGEEHKFDIHGDGGNDAVI